MHTIAHARPASAEPVNSSQTLGLRLFLAFYAWLERARQRHALSELDEHMLKDIGLTRADVTRETDKPFWQT